MNRSFVSVILGGFGADNSTDGKKKRKINQLKVVTQRMQLLMKNASSVIIVPGYGGRCPSSALFERW